LGSIDIGLELSAFFPPTDQEYSLHCASLFGASIMIRFVTRRCECGRLRGHE
jgi:hypothetical protein